MPAYKNNKRLLSFTSIREWIATYELTVFPRQYNCFPIGDKNKCYWFLIWLRPDKIILHSILSLLLSENVCVYLCLCI